jgi:four helix bundle protein
MSFQDELQERFRQLALQFAAFVRRLPCTEEAREWGTQLRRASSAASAIYRSTRTAKSKADWLDKLADTLEEVDECDHWMTAIEDNGVSKVPQDLRSENRQLRSIISKSLATGRRNERKKKRPRKPPDSN